MITAQQMVSDASRIRREARERRRDELERLRQQRREEHQRFLDERRVEHERRRAEREERERDSSALTFLTPQKLTLLERTFGKLTLNQRERLARIAEEWRALKSEMLAHRRIELTEEHFVVGSSLDPSLLNQCGVDLGDGDE